MSKSVYLKNEVDEDDIIEILEALNVSTDHIPIIQRYIVNELSRDDEIEIDDLFTEHPRLRDAIRELTD